MRGKESHFRRSLRRHGITPAYAGKSKLLFRKRSISQDHPRLCGEKLTYPSCSAGSAGSPPPMRGKVKSLSISYVENRITPAYAGKRCFESRCGKLFWDHPRLCGEKGESVKLVHKHVGSPPPMRGKAEFAKAEGIHIGITPAYAGKRIELCAERAVL